MIASAGSEIGAGRQPDAAPWDGSRRLWSLWELTERFRAVSFSAALGHLQTASGQIAFSNAMGISQDDASDREHIKFTLNSASQVFPEMPLSHVTRGQLEHLQAAVNTAGGAELAIMIRELVNNIYTELSASWFLMIPADHRHLYEQIEPPFGSSVSQEFPEAFADVAAAGRCFALDEWTACVFHLMRVLEHSLRKMSERVGLQSDATAYENWRNVIDQIEAKIRLIEKEPKTPDKIERLKLYSDVAVQFRYFKDAWRNHICHARVTYDKHTAQPILLHVQLLTQQLAILPPL